MENTRNCMEEAILSIIGNMASQYELFSDFENQLKLKSILEESLHNYRVTTLRRAIVVANMSEHIEKYLTMRSLEGIAPGTTYNYMTILSKFKEFFYARTLSSIETSDIQYFLVLYKKERQVKNSTLNGIIWCLKTFFQYLMDNEIILKNPMIRVKEIKTEKRLKKVMTDEQVELLKDACVSVKDKLLVNLALDTGCRVSEIANMSLSSIDFVDLEICVVGKGNKERIVYFTEKTKLLLTKYVGTRKEHEEHDALFLADKFPHQRIKPRALQLQLDKIKKRARLTGVDYITMHGCRRKLATHLINKNVNIESIRCILGHSTTSTTLAYSQIQKETVKRDYHIGI